MLLNDWAEIVGRKKMSIIPHWFALLTHNGSRIICNRAAIYSIHPWFNNHERNDLQYHGQAVFGSTDQRVWNQALAPACGSKCFIEMSESFTKFMCHYHVDHPGPLSHF